MIMANVYLLQWTDEIWLKKNKVTIIIIIIMRLM